MEKIYPAIRSLFQPEAIGQGPWPNAKRIGATIHHAAHRDLEAVFREALKSKLGYHLIIDREGAVCQTTYFDRTVWHAGRAQWRGLSPNRAHVGICLLSWGRLRCDESSGKPVFKAWAGAAIPALEVELRPDAFGKRAYWDAATPAQEAALLEALRWLVEKQGVSPFDICGHDECALPRGRKDDPGGVIRWTMPQLRDLLVAKAWP